MIANKFKVQYELLDVKKKVQGIIDQYSFGSESSALSYDIKLKLLLEDVSSLLKTLNKLEVFKK